MMSGVSVGLCLPQGCQNKWISCDAINLCLDVKLLNTKRNLIYIRNQSVPRSKLSTTVIKTNQLMMYKAKVAVCSDIRTKLSTQSERHVEFFNVKPGGT